jgi:hypothetical protein
MLLLSAVFAAIILTTLATMVGSRKTAAAVRKPMPAKRDAFDAPTLPVHRSSGLTGR